MWLASLPGAPATDAAADARRIYVPVHSDGTDEIVALDRGSGDELWRSPAATRWPPIVSGSSLLVAVADGILQFDAETGMSSGQVRLADPLAAPMAAAGTRVLAPLESGAVAAIADGRVEWTRTVGAIPKAVAIANGIAAAVLSDARVVALAPDSGEVLWTSEPLAGTLTTPVFSNDRVFVGSSENALFALDARTGRYLYTVTTGGSVVGMAADDTHVYIASLDNVVRAVRAGSGNQRWKHITPTRAITPPQLHRGTVLIHGNQPVLIALDVETGEEKGTFQLADELGSPLVQGAPIILVPTEQEPIVAAVIVTRTGAVLGLGPAAPAKEDPPAKPDAKPSPKSEPSDP